MTGSAFLKTWQQYQAAWADMADDDRRALLETSVAMDAIYSDPGTLSHGIDELVRKIEDSQAKMPGATFRNDSWIEHHDQGLSTWTMFDGKRNEAANGTSYAQFGNDGKLVRMTGFFATK